MHSAMRRSATIAAVTTVLCAAAVTIVACGDDEQAATAPTSATYVGALRGTDALVGIATRGSRVRAYVCDGRTVATWFDGTLDGDAADLAGTGGERLHVELGDGAATGSVTLGGGRRSTFAAEGAKGDAGLYRGAYKDATAGWIVLADGTQRGGVGTPATFAAAPRLTTTAILDGRIAITPIPIPSAGPQLRTIGIAPGGGIR